MFSQSVDIQVPCNTNLKVGDIINCIFPELNDGNTSVQLDGQSSGNYLIARLNHHLQGNASFTSLNLVRDSYGYSQIKLPSNVLPTQTKAYENNRDKQRRLRKSRFN